MSRTTRSDRLTARPASGAWLGAAAEAPVRFPDVDLLRLTTAGSVDDGKSTLIGRLLYDTKTIFEDQLEAVARTSRQRGDGHVNLALLTDGLRAEREQNITIDVAYRYFATPRRKFIIADTPGHVQYTRNMVTGASTAELAIVLVDARKGILTQSRRHGFLASLLGIPHLVIAVNKMDLVEYSEEVFEEIRRGYLEFAAKLEVPDLTFVPISALTGENVARKSDRMPWYDGGTLLHHLETVPVGGTRNLVDFRFPVQTVIRPDQDFRGIAGRVASGTIRAGEPVVALPSGVRTRVRSVETAAGPLESARAGESVILTLEDEIDLSRGEMLVRTRNLPSIGTRLDALVCWMSETPLDSTVPYRVMHTTRETQAYVSELVYRIDVDTLHREEADTLRLNDIARVGITTSQPLFFDPYARNRRTGGFILVHPHTHATVAAGMIRGEMTERPATPARARRPGLSSDVTWEAWNIGRPEREDTQGHPAAVLWFTGLSGSGKSTLARALERELFANGCRTMLLDGDQIRRGLCRDLGFSPPDREENIRRAGEVARLFFAAGNIVLCTFVSPYREDRQRVRAMFPAGRFFEIHVDAELRTIQERDTKGLYARAQRGEIHDLTGVGSPYEPPETPEIVLRTDRSDVEMCVRAVFDCLRERNFISRSANGRQPNLA